MSRRRDPEDDGYNPDSDGNGDRASLRETMFFKKTKDAAIAISERTSLSFKLLLPLGMIVIVSTVRVMTGVGKIEHALDRSWSVNQMEAWARELRRENPTLKVPDVREVFEQRPNGEIKIIP